MLLKLVTPHYIDLFIILEALPVHCVKIGQELNCFCKIEVEAKHFSIQMELREVRIVPVSIGLAELPHGSVIFIQL